MNKIYLLLLALVSTFTLSAQIRFENTTWKEALAKAKKENKIIFLYGYDVLCEPCNFMENNVFTDSSVGHYYNKTFINIKMNLKKREGKESPTLHFFNSDGQLVHTKLEMTKIEDFIQLGKDAINPAKQLYTLSNKYYAGKATDNDIKNYFTALKNSGVNIQLDLFKQVLINKESHEKIVDKEKLNKLIYYAALRDGGNQREKSIDRKTMLNHYLKYLNKNQAQIYADADYIYALIIKKDDKFITETQEVLKENRDFGADFYNTIAWYFYKNVDDVSALEDALVWVDRSINKLQYAYNIDTKAAILYKLKRKKEALHYAKRAIAVGKKEGTDMANTQALIRKINAL